MSNIPEYSVSEISKSIKSNLEGQFSRVKIKGEISGLTKANSGHYYFNLKDETATLSSIIWRSTSNIIEVSPEEGLEIVALGKISTYMPRSNYNFIIENIYVAGEGALLKIIEDRKKRLKKLGFFDQENKKKIPFLPSKIGIITSSTGAVIQDMKKRIKERFPSHLMLWSVPVQGPKCEKVISEAIKGFNLIQDKPDVIILARGGGSLEDIMAFNSEEIASSIFESKIPIISAVGHETDFTISDLVADIRASTPTAAADLVVPEKIELKEKINNLLVAKNSNLENIFNMKSYKLDNFNLKLSEPKKYLESLEFRVSNEYLKIENFFTNYLKRIENLIKNLSLLDPNKKIIDLDKELKKIYNYFNKNFDIFIEKKKNKFNNQLQILSSCSYERWLEKGFVIVNDLNNKLVKNLSELENNKDIIIKFSDGEATAKIIESTKKK